MLPAKTIHGAPIRAAIESTESRLQLPAPFAPTHDGVFPMRLAGIKSSRCLQAEIARGTVERMAGHGVQLTH
jgi:hypothetical protein